MGHPLFLCRGNWELMHQLLLHLFNPQRSWPNTYRSHLLLNKWRGWWAKLIAVFGQGEGIESLIENALKEARQLWKPKRKVASNGFSDFFFPPSVRLLRLL